jgi:hypothetical protein
LGQYCNQVRFDDLIYLSIQKEEEIKLGKRQIGRANGPRKKSSKINQISIPVSDYTTPSAKASKTKNQNEGSPLLYFLKVKIVNKILQVLFKEKPVWTINALQSRLKQHPNLKNCSFFQLKKALSSFTYLFK